jgi:C1A family cysteine protease
LTIKRYGWVRDERDVRDFVYQRRFHTKDLPEKVDLRKFCPPVYEQGHLGSCSANAIAASLEYSLIKQKQDVFVPSRLFIYYNERFLWKTVQYDSGAPIRLGAKAVKKFGVCDEYTWPYNLRMYRKRPPDECYRSANKYKSILYERIKQDVFMMKDCIASGIPFVFGFIAFESFEGEKIAKDGMLQMPRQGEKKMGQHSVLAVGYDDRRKVIIARNSWGKSWGEQGYFYMPYSYLLREELAGDFWALSFLDGN